MKVTILILFTVLQCLFVQAQDTTRLAKVYNPSKPAFKDKGPKTTNTEQSNEDIETVCFPMSDDNVYKVYKYIINLNDPKVIRRYRAFFDKHNYAFTGYVWEGLLKRMLNDADKNISDNVVFRVDKNIVAIKVTNYNITRKFPGYICPLLSDLKIFERYLKNLNRNSINNY